MCVIAFSPKGVDIPTEEQLKSMWHTNPDGAGYAFVGRNGKVFYRKGIMTLDRLLEELKNREQFKNTMFAVHMRIRTSGEKDRKTCHPFPISTRFEDLVETEGIEDGVLFHNGVIGDGGIVSPLASDTQDFVAAMTPLLAKYSKSKARDHYINQLVEGSRLLVMYKGGRFKMYGNWKKDGDLWVSNLNYKDDYRWMGYGYSDWYSDWYKEKKANDKLAEALEPSTETKLTDEERQEATQLWADIVSREYKFVSASQLELLKRTCDGKAGDVMEYAGYTFGYDSNQLLVWCTEEEDV